MAAVVIKTAAAISSNVITFNGLGRLEESAEGKREIKCILSILNLSQKTIKVFHVCVLLALIMLFIIVLIEGNALDCCFPWRKKRETRKWRAVNVVLALFTNHSFSARQVTASEWFVWLSKNR